VGKFEGGCKWVEGFFINFLLNTIIMIHNNNNNNLHLEFYQHKKERSTSAYVEVVFVDGHEMERETVIV
jgi:hypothetical protein